MSHTGSQLIGTAPVVLSLSAQHLNVHCSLSETSVLRPTRGPVVGGGAEVRVTNVRPTVHHSVRSSGNVFASLKRGLEYGQTVVHTFLATLFDKIRKDFLRLFILEP